MHVIYIVWIKSNFLFFILLLAKLHEKHSCYSGIPNTALCNDPDATERIAIYDLQYARNCSKCHCSGSSSTCGQFTLPGSWENYYYYNAISGTQGSQFTTQRTPCPNSGTGGIYTNLVYLRFECVPGEFILRNILVLHSHWKVEFFRIKTLKRLIFAYFLFTCALNIPNSEYLTIRFIFAPL